ncbi:MAG: hypothetical protein KAV18_03860 [Candidatus Omnitrophica bacterium]|nr:hypothetical protein [Candidatus Omnitrophota bacterium]
MKKKKEQKKPHYSARYDSNNLTLTLKQSFSLKVDLSNNLEVGVLISTFRDSGLGSSRELGQLFKRSASTVVRKERLKQSGGRGLEDKRGQSRQYKAELVRADILLIWQGNPHASDKEILEALKPRLSEVGMSLDIKTLKKYLEAIGISEARTRLRAEEAMRKQAATDTGAADIISHQDDDPVAAGVIAADTSEIKNTAGLSSKKDKELVKTDCRYAGQLLHAPYLCKLGFKNMLDIFTQPRICVYTKEQIMYTLYFLYAAGLKRVYDLDTVDHESFGALIGADDNIRSSGMNKRIAGMSNPALLDLLDQKALAGRAWLLTKKDELVYADSHVVETWVSPLIAMARHGTKAKQVKAINVHALIGSDSGTPIITEYSQGNKRLHWAIPRVLEKSEPELKKQGKRIKIICFDKGGISLPTFRKIVLELKKGFLCWAKRTAYVQKQINKLKEKRFKYRRKKELRQNGKKIIVEEKIADTTTHLNEWGKVRTIVVQLPSEEYSERLCLYTNLSRAKYSALEVREMVSYRQREENYFKIRKYKSALDCFGGGKCRAKSIRRPSEKEKDLLEKQSSRQEKSIEEDNDDLNEMKEFKKSKLLKEKIVDREIVYLERQIKKTKSNNKKTAAKLEWAHGGKRPSFIKQRYEIELNKQRFLGIIQETTLLAKRESLKDFIKCYEKVLGKECFSDEEITSRMEFLDRTAIEKLLFNLSGQVVRDEAEGKIIVYIRSQGREYFKKALALYLNHLNKKQAQLDYGRLTKYRLYFYLSPDS